MADPNHVPRGALQEEKEMADSLRPAKIECPFCCRSFSKLKPHLQTCRGKCLYKKFVIEIN